MTYDPDAALDAALEVFWSQGYEATSLQDLLTAMDLSKSSFYQAFGSKKELFLRCMGRYRQRIGTRLRKLLDERKSGLAFIETVLLSSANESRQPLELRRGCLLMNTASEFAQKDREIALHVANGFEGLRTILIEAVRLGQAAGEIAASLDPGQAGSYLISTLGGLKTVVKGGADEQQVREIVAVALRALR
ncbi:TetR/AcrR family transcriptional regulator [Geomesophilobacter sediminis]|uniref:TetR/AcrR family transcriptional regulator n=1 Tax=Geomesophilobacter sediminis TaxID=2798584 RepID=A0A8J7LUB4_9BACT|nr:TetR/AcrR family transcriptional regulator [Geomesophilobacter sediminis]MBJ6724454.1 TetR/AcrR family transcriptional regulator [Geomesophilobacter sediminis]